MARKPKAILREQLFVPLHLANTKAIKKHLHINHFNEKGCNSAGENGTVCPYKSERPCETCWECPNFSGTFKFYKKVNIEGRKYIGIATGRTDIVNAVVGDKDQYELINMRVDKPAVHNLKFVGKLYDYQVAAVDKLLKKKRGLLKSMPRTGKTVMFINAACRLGLKTLIIAHQDDLLLQAYNTFYSQEPKFTNAQDIYDKTGTYPVIIAQKDSDYFGDADVVLTTYQKFISPKGQKLLKKVAKHYGCVIFDEVHKSNAQCYSKVAATLYPKHMYGVTATVERKDGLEFIANRIVGPVISKTTAKGMTPKVQVVISDMKAKVKARHWTAIVKALYRNTPRNMGIVKHVIKDLKAGHSIVIPATQRWYIDAMCEEINKAWMIETGTSEVIAKPFYRYGSKHQKEEILNEARSGKIRVIVAMRSMLLGVNVPKWSAIYEVSPINNPPNFQQEVERVCTPYEGKKPIIKFFVDIPSQASINCFLACLTVCKKLGYDIDPKSKQNIEYAASQSKRGFVEESSLGATMGMPGKRITL